MTLLYISTEELGMLALSSGAGSVATAFALFFGKEAWSNNDQLVTFATAGFVIVAVVTYILFFGLIRRIRRRNKLAKWSVFGN